MKFLFGDIVVVERYLIGVIVKSWTSSMRGNYYEVYVRNYNRIREYDEEDIERYMVRHKELNEEEMYYQQEAMCFENRYTEKATEKTNECTKKDKYTREEQAFIDGMELAIDWNLRPIPEENYKRYYELINRK